MNNQNTCYGPVSEEVMARAGRVRLLICDVDGVLSDGFIYMGNNGEELKAFNVRDGYGIRALLNSGLEMSVITGRTSKLVEDRCRTLGVPHVYQGQSDKRRALTELVKKLELSLEQIAYIGDDLIDMPVIERVGLGVAVADAHPVLLSSAHYVTRMPGGRGAVREICDLILIAQGAFEGHQGQSI